MTLTLVTDFFKNNRTVRASPVVMMAIKSTADDQVYLMEADPTTGQLPVTTTGGGLSQVLPDQVCHNAVNIATAATGSSAAPGITLKVTFDALSYKQAVLFINWASMSTGGTCTVQVAIAKNVSSAYIPCPDLLFTIPASAAGDGYMILFPTPFEFMQIIITKNSETLGIITTSLTLKDPT